MRSQDLPIEEEEDPLPEGVETALWVGHGEFFCGNPQDYADDPVFEDMDLGDRPKPHRPDEEAQPTIIFEAGDEVPVDMARDVWESMGRSFALFDADGERVDEPAGERHEDPMAVERWQMRTEVAEAQAEG